MRCCQGVSEKDYRTPIPLYDSFAFAAAAAVAIDILMRRSLTANAHGFLPCFQCMHRRPYIHHRAGDYGRHYWSSASNLRTISLSFSWIRFARPTHSIH
jgi:hypothetical protein